MSDTEQKHISEPEARRLEIFTGAGRRRRWPAESKARIVAESYAEGTTVSSVARRHGLTVQQLFAWRRRCRRPATETGQHLSFAPVVVDRHAMVPRADDGDRSASIVVEVAGAVVRIPSGASAASVAAVLQALRSAT